MSTVKTIQQPVIDTTPAIYSDDGEEHGRECHIGYRHEGKPLCGLRGYVAKPHTPDTCRQNGHRKCPLCLLVWEKENGTPWHGFTG